MHLDRDALERAGRVGEGRGREVVGGRVLQIAREGRRVGDHGRRLDRARDVVVGGDDQLLDRAVVRRGALVAREPVGGEQRALDERARHGVVDVVGELPAEPPAPELLRAPEGDRGRDARAFGVERAARPEADEQPAAPGRMGDREVAEGGARLALVDEALERAVLDVVRHGLAVEHPDDERVCAAVGRGRGCR